MKSIVLLVIFWIGYGCLHSGLATLAVKEKFRSMSYYRLVYNLIALLTLLPIVYFQQNAPVSIVMKPDTMNYILGGLMVGSGFYTAFISFQQYNLAAFLGFKPEDTRTLQTEGILSLVRHPLYLATLLVVWGSFGVLGTDLSCTTAICISLYVRVGIYFEEKKLVQIFGKAYIDYQKKVPMLIPKLQ